MIVSIKLLGAMQLLTNARRWFSGIGTSGDGAPAYLALPLEEEHVDHLRQVVPCLHLRELEGDCIQTPALVNSSPMCPCCEELNFELEERVVDQMRTIWDLAELLSFALQ